MKAGTPALMLQGTASHVGKSLLLAGLCRAFARRGIKVRPFKPQNLSNNAAVAADGGEIGRAQALQARACGVAPSVHMNPVLLKPQADGGAQLVVQGKVAGTLRAGAPRRHDLLQRVLASFRRTAAEADLVLVEGAGSPAEVNLRAGDIANMGFALAARVPVAVVADVDRGGAIASLVGTWMLLAAEERALVRGYLVNRLRGEPRLFAGALPAIEAQTGLDCLGVVPWFARAHELPAEDAVTLETAAPAAAGAIRIAVPRLPCIANFDDLDPLAAEADVAVDVVPPGRPLPGDADLVLLPGSKSARTDLAALRAEGWDIDILAHRRRGGRVLGLCGGYQMLGRRVADPAGAEGPPGEAPGLGLLAVETVIGADKRLAPAVGRCVETGAAVSGYEMRMGETDGPDRARPMLRLADGRADGACAPDGLVQGCYLHGLFAADEFRRAFLGRLQPGRRSALAYESRVEGALDALAEHVAAAVDLDRLLAIAAGRQASRRR